MANDMAEGIVDANGVDATTQRFDDVLYDTHNIVTASDLYAHHILPSIIADLEAMGVTCDQQYHADVQAGMRWHFLDAQQQGFWHKQIKMFRSGYHTPLDGGTYFEFCATRHLLKGSHDSGADDTQDTPDITAKPSSLPRPTALGSVDEYLSTKSTTPVRRSVRLIKQTRKAEAFAGACRDSAISVREKLSPHVPEAAKTLRRSHPAVKSLDAAVVMMVPEAEPATPATPYSTTDINKCQAPPFTAQAPPIPTRRSKKRKAIRARGVQENHHDNAIVHSLGGHAMRLQIPDFTAGIAAIVQSINVLLGKDAGLTLQGRCRSQRVNFDPRARGVTSIRDRLLQAVARGEWIDMDDRKLWTPKATIGFMLRFFVDWNRFSHTFQDFRPTRVKQKSALKCANEYASRWTWAECLAGVIGPTTYTRSYEVVGVIMQSLRERAEKLCPAALTTGVYGLLEHDRGFARMLLGCFSYTTLSHEEYKDLMEQKMFRLNRKHPRLCLPQR